MCELTGQELYQSFAAVVVRGGCSSINTLMPRGGSLVKVTSESAECNTHDAVVGIRTRLQVNRDVWDKLRVWLPRDDVVKTFPIRGQVLRDVYPFGTEKIVLTWASSLSPANRKSEVSLLSLARSFLPYAPIILQPFSPTRIPVLALASLNKNR